MTRRLLVLVAALIPQLVGGQIPNIPTGPPPTVDLRIVGVSATLFNALAETVRPQAVEDNVRDVLSFATAEQNENPIVRAWSLQRSDSQAFNVILRTHKFARSDTPVVRAVQAVFYTSLASDTAQLNALLRAIAGSPPADTARLRQEIKAIHDRVLQIIGQQSGVNVMVFATGDVRTATAKDVDDFKSGTGSLGAQFVNGVGRQIMASMAIASTETRVASEFGSAILAPARGQAFKSGVLSGYWPRAGWSTLGINYLYGTVSVERWQYTTSPADTHVVSATVLGTGLIHRGEMGCCAILQNEIRAYVDLGLAVRWVSGDISNRDSIREALLKTNRTVFVGPETGIQIQFGRVVGALQLYYLFAADRAAGPIHVDGLTRLQAVAAFTVTGEVFRGPLSR